METERPDDQLQQPEQYEDVDPESLGYQDGWTGEEEAWIGGRRSAV